MAVASYADELVLGVLLFGVRITVHDSAYTQFRGQPRQRGESVSKQVRVEADSFLDGYCSGHFLQHGYTQLLLSQHDIDIQTETYPRGP
jgi:hypothetical protein